MTKNTPLWFIFLFLSISSFTLWSKGTLYSENINCDPLLADQLTVVRISEFSATINTAQPYGQVNNIFRYRVNGASDWITLTSSTDPAQTLTGLFFGQTYEFQVNHECNAGEWSGFSESQTFTTLGFITCQTIWFADKDQDGFGDPNDNISGCSPPLGYVNNPEDCDDTDSNLPGFPGAACQGGIIAEDGCTCNTIIEITDETNDPTNDDLLIDGTKMTTSSISEHNAYIYTPQPHGIVQNQFRYRPVGTSDWQMTDISTSYYRYLKDLLAGTEYEFQVRHERIDGSFYNFSASSQFTTTGSSEVDQNGEIVTVCTAIPQVSLFVSSVSQMASYVYTPQPFGESNNQFRYRPVGSTEWLLSDVSMVYYRYLTDLMPSTTYEYQVRQECSAGNWSDYSASFEFTTAN